MRILMLMCTGPYATGQNYSTAHVKVHLHMHPDIASQSPHFGDTRKLFVCEQVAESTLNARQWHLSRAHAYSYTN